MEVFVTFSGKIKKYILNKMGTKAYFGFHKEMNLSVTSGFDHEYSGEMFVSGVTLFYSRFIQMVLNDF